MVAIYIKLVPGMAIMKIIYNINGKDEEISRDELESSKGPQSGQPNFGTF